MTNEYNFTIVLHPWGTDPERGTVGIDPAALYGYWERKNGSEGGGLWFSQELINGRLDQKGPLELIDYDGAVELPRSVVAALREADITVDDSV